MEIRKVLGPDEITYLHPFPPIQPKNEEKEEENLDESLPIPEITTIPLDPNEMFIQILSAKAFVDYCAKKTRDKLVLDISIAGKRYRTPKIDACVEPKFECSISIILDLPIIDLVRFGNASVVVLSENPKKSFVYGYGFFDWRFALSGYLRAQVVLKGNGDEDNGYLDIKINLANRLISQKQLEKCISSITTSHTFICKLSSRALPTPMHAFRFVQLLSKQKTNYLNLVDLKTGEAIPTFSIHSILASRTSNINELTILLVCLLCGFGLDAYLYGDKAVTVGNDGTVVEWSIPQKRRIILDTIEALPLIGFRKVVKPITERPTTDIYDQLEWKTVITAPPSVTPHIMPSIAINEVELENCIKAVLRCFVKDINFDKELEKYLRPIVGTLEARELECPDEAWSAPIGRLIQSKLPKQTSLKIGTVFSSKLSPEYIAEKVYHKCNNLFQMDYQKVGLSICTHSYAEEVYAIWVVIAFIVKDDNESSSQ